MYTPSSYTQRIQIIHNILHHSSALHRLHWHHPPGPLCQPCISTFHTAFHQFSSFLASVNPSPPSSQPCILVFFSSILFLYLRSPLHSSLVKPLCTLDGPSRHGNLLCRYGPLFRFLGFPVSAYSDSASISEDIISTFDFLQHPQHATRRLSSSHSLHPQTQQTQTQARNSCGTSRLSLPVNRVSQSHGDDSVAR